MILKEGKYKKKKKTKRKMRCEMRYYMQCHFLSPNLTFINTAKNYD